MKDFKEYINETIKPKQTIFYFKNCSVLSLYCFEMIEQITNGKYKNINTGWHDWISSYDIKLGESGYKSPYKIYTYTITDLYKKNINNCKNRIYYCAKYANVIDNFNFIHNIYIKFNLSKWFPIFVTYFCESIENGKSFEETMNFIFNKYDEIYKTTKSVNKIKDYLNILFYKHIYNKYKNNKYSESDLIEDLETLDETFKNKITY